MGKKSKRRIALIGAELRLPCRELMEALIQTEEAGIHSSKALIDMEENCSLIVHNNGLPRWPQEVEEVLDSISKELNLAQELIDERNKLAEMTGAAAAERDMAKEHDWEAEFEAEYLDLVKQMYAMEAKYEGKVKDTRMLITTLKADKAISHSLDAFMCEIDNVLESDAMDEKGKKRLIKQVRRIAKTTFKFDNWRVRIANGYGIEI